MIFETHAHYDDEQFAGDRDALLSSLLAGDIGKIINVGASIATTEQTLALAERYSQVYAAVGVHPCDVGDLNEETYDWLSAQTRHPKTVAVGEIGLDYYWEKDPNARELQQSWFRRQLELAAQSSLPVIIHSRDAAEETFQAMKEAAKWGIPGVIHCYSYSAELAKEFVRLGYYIGVGGVVTFKNAKKLKETVQQVPLERILLETDCPYMAPEPYRGKRNNSAYLSYVAEEVARLKGVSAAEVEDVTWRNAERLFLSGDYAKRDNSGVSAQ